MSGRVRVRLSDGRSVTGFRKTLRRNPRLRPEQRPQLRLTFQLPDKLAFCTRSGIYGFAEVDADGMVTVRGFEREFILRKAGEFLKSIGHGLTLDPIDATMFTPTHQGPNGATRLGGQDGYEIVVATGQPSVTLVRAGAGKAITV